MQSDEPIQRLQFLMRSGNSFVVDGVTDWTIKTRDNSVVGLNLTQKTDASCSRLIVDSIDLSQIEAIVCLPTK